MNETICGYDGDSFPHSLLRASQSSTLQIITPNLFCFILPDPKLSRKTIDPTSNNDQTHDRLETLRPDELGLKLVRFDSTKQGGPLFRSL